MFLEHMKCMKNQLVKPNMCLADMGYTRFECYWSIDLKGKQYTRLDY